MLDDFVLWKKGKMTAGQTDAANGHGKESDD